MDGQSIQHGFWYYNWGNVASATGIVMSAIGIGFTIWTLKTAKSAEKAAIDAKNSAATLSFSNDARKAERHNKEVILHIQAAHFGDAVFRSADLLELVAELYERCPAYASSELRTTLLKVRTECEQNDKAIRKINIDLNTPTSRETERVVQRANSIHQSIVKVRIASNPE